MSVVAISYQSAHLLCLALVALNWQSLPDDVQMEVVVVDDGSTDGTAERVAKLDLGYPLVFIHRPRDESSSRARARNVGVASARGEIVVLVDGDQIPGPDFVASHAAFHQHAGGLAVVGLRSRLAPGAIAADALDDGFDLARLPAVVRDDNRIGVIRQYSENLADLCSDWHLAYSCNLSLSRRMYFQAGGFNEDFKGWGLEDCEFGWRLRNTGARLVLNTADNLFEPDSGHPGLAGKFEDWHRNLATLKTSHPHYMIHALDVFSDVFQPAASNWVERCIRFESALRLLSRRALADDGWVSVTLEGAVDEQALREALAEHAGRHIVVFDETATPANAVAVRGLAADWRVSLFAHRARRGGYDGHAAWQSTTARLRARHAAEAASLRLQ